MLKQKHTQKFYHNNTATLLHEQYHSAPQTLAFIPRKHYPMNITILLPVHRAYHFTIQTSSLYHLWTKCYHFTTQKFLHQTNITQPLAIRTLLNQLATSELPLYHILLWYSEMKTFTVHLRS